MALSTDLDLLDGALDASLDGLTTAITSSPALHTAASIETAVKANASTSGNDALHAQSGTETFVYNPTETGSAPSFSNLRFAQVDADALSLGTSNGGNIGLSSFSAGVLTVSSTLTLAGTAGADNITGTSGRDHINAGAGDDVVHAGAGDDKITGGLGDDILYGQAGRDTFLYGPSGWGADTIADFDHYDDTLRFGGDLTYADFSFSQIGSDGIGDTLITNIHDGSIIRLSGVGLIGLWEQNFSGISGTMPALAGHFIGTADADSMNGLGGADVLDGGDGGDQLFGGYGNDVITGGAGDDSLRGGTSMPSEYNMHNGQDRFVFAAGSGHDIIGDFDAGVNGDILDYSGQGLNFNDLSFSWTWPELTITNGLTGDSVILWNVAPSMLTNANFLGVSGTFDLTNYGTGGTSGDDVILGTANDDIMAGGAGNDTYTVNTATDVVFENADEGIDTVQSSWGVTTLTTNVENLVLLAGSNANGTGNDLANVITGNSHDNSLSGLGGGDTIYGGLGNDALNGGDGDDILRGEAGNDTLTGGDGNDAIYGGADSNSLTGGGGNDRFVFDSSVHYDRITDFASGAGSDDALDFTGLGLSFADFQFAQSGMDSRITVNGSIITLADVNFRTLHADDFIGVSGTFHLPGLYGTAGDDTLTCTSAGEYINAGAGHDSVFAGAGNDTIYGGAGNDTLRGEGGNDTIFADSGMDTLIGGDGGDILIGGAEANLLYGGTGYDTMTGGAGSDTFVIEANSGNDIITDFKTGDSAGDVLDFTGLGLSFSDFRFSTSSGSSVTINWGTGNNLELRGVESLAEFQAQNFQGVSGTFNIPNVLGGTSGNDTLIGSSANETIGGNNGDDSVFSGAGDDYIYGGAGDDVLRGESGLDWIWGGNGADWLIGGANGDNLFGGDGDDVLNGGTDTDVLTGGAGNDRFVFDAGWEWDSINDFQTGAGSEDVLDFSGLGLTLADFTISQSFANTLITQNGTGNTVLLMNTLPSALHSDDFIF